MYNIKVGLKGKYKIEKVFNANTSEEYKIPLTEWFDNIITDMGLNLFFTETDGRYTMSHCLVGTGNSTPNVGDVWLDSYLAYTSTLQAHSVSNSGAPNYTKIWTGTFRLGAGVGTGNISEVGIGYYSSSRLFSRALILDGGGSPTTITKLSDEVLDITYEFQIQLPTSDVSGSVVITGDKGGTYSYTLRASGIDDVMSMQSYFPCFIGLSQVAFAYNGSIGTILDTPSGTLSTGSTSANSYSSGNFYRDTTSSFSISQGNLSGGISAMRFGVSGLMFQIGFDTAIPKTSSDTFSLVYRYTASRA